MIACHPDEAKLERLGRLSAGGGFIFDEVLPQRSEDLLVQPLPILRALVVAEEKGDNVRGHGEGAS